MEKYDCIIIGGGIAGITASIYLKNAHKKVLLIEKSAMGGLLNKISEINNYPGLPNISGPDFAFKLYEQVKKMEIEILLDTVIKVEHEDNRNIVKLKDKELECRFLILATGKEARKLELPHEEELLGHGISYCALCDGNFFKNQEVAVIGAGESAIHEALYLTNICSKVTIINKYPEFKTKEDVLDDFLKKPNAKVLYNARTTSLNVKDNKLSTITIEKDGKEQELEVKGVFVYIGSTPNIFTELNLTLDGKYLKVANDCQTNLDTIYAIGDIIKKDYYQLVGAANEGMIAATSIIRRLNKE